jgi:hypothetical protein
MDNKDDDGDGDDGGGGKTTSGIDFTSHNTDYSILVRNNTRERLVAFRGDLHADMLIGGIPARTNNHGLPKDPKLFSQTDDFSLILLTESQYNANKSDLASLRNTPFTRIYVFYNASGDNTAVYEIAEGLGGSNELHIINPSTTLNIELRVNGVNGETLGYAPAGILNTTLRLNDGNFNVFPVFKRYNKTRDTLETMGPTMDDEKTPWFQSVSFGDEGVRDYEMNLRDLLQNLNITSGAAWVIVVNQSTAGGIRFVEGGNVHKTASGLENIMTERYFKIDMPAVGNNYADSKTVVSWKFGPTGFEVPLKVSASDNTDMENFIIERDKMYTITVTGNHTQNTLKAFISDEKPIDTNDFHFE